MTLAVFNGDIHNMLIISAVILLLVVFILVIIFHRKLLDISPAILTSSGILFTFIGITVGLYNFNSNLDSNQGINQLLNGLKLAFVPSAFAVFLSIILKFFIAKKTDVNIVADFRGDIQEVASVIRNCFGEISTQLISFQNDLLTKQTELLTNSLQNVFDDFNVKISDKLGDNFKVLSTSVGELCIWQREYKELLVKIKDDYSNMLENAANSHALVKNSGEALGVIASNFKQVEDSVNNICTTLGATQSGLENSNSKIIDNTHELNNLLEQKLGLVNKHIAQCNDILTMFSNTANTIFGKMSAKIATS